MLAAAARWQVDEREGERGTSGFAFLLNRLELGLIEEALNVVDAGFVVRRLRGGTGVSRGKGSSPGAELKGLGSAEPGCLPGQMPRQRGAEAVGGSSLKSEKGERVRTTQLRCCFCS